MDVYKSHRIWVILLKEPEALLDVIISKNSNTLHFAITCMPSWRFAAR